MTIKSLAELEGLRKVGGIVADCLELMKNSLEPGITTKELDDIGGQFLSRNGARSAPQLTYGFPGFTCISINNRIAHGIPGDEKVRPSDLVNIDVSAELDGFFADTGATFIVPPKNQIKEHVCQATKQALDGAMSAARADQPLNRIGWVIEKIAKRHKLTIIENLASHGVGRALHEEPSAIASYFDRRDSRVLREGMVITIEPFLSNGARKVAEEEDGWTLSTAKHFISAQYEHTLVITRGQPLVMTLPTSGGNSLKAWH